MTTSLLHYRGWQGRFRGPMASVWPIARVALATLLRRRMFWVLYSAGLLLFLLFFMGTYILDFAESRIPTDNIKFGKMNIKPDQILQFIRRLLDALNGSRETFSEFFRLQAVMVVVTLALAGSIMVGNDFTHRSLPFYLAKPIGRRHYLLGKGLAIAVVVNMLTTLPALVLFVQHGMEDYHYLIDVDYFRSNGASGGPASWQLLLGILGFGLILSTCLSIFLLTLATAVRRTVPLVMTWVSMFLFLRILANVLVTLSRDESEPKETVQWGTYWRLLDLWNDMSLLGRACFGYTHAQFREPQPSFLAAGLVLAGVSIICLIYLSLRTRAVDIIR